MKVVFALQVVLMQCMWVDAVMYKDMQYTTTTCDAGSEDELEWSPAGTCFMIDQVPHYAKVTCAAAGVTYTIYSDATCATVDTAYTSSNTAITVSNGVATVAGCLVEGSEGSTNSCQDAQPEQVTFSVFSDGNCTTAHTMMAKTIKAVGTCEYDLGGSSSSSSTTSGNGSRLLQALQTPFDRKLAAHATGVAQKTMWDDSTKKATTTYYSDKTCTTAVGSTSLMDFGSDGTTCVMVGTGVYYKYDSRQTAAAAQSQANVQTGVVTASGCDRMQSLFLLPLLVFLGVPKMMML